MNLDALRALFTDDELEWKPQTLTRNGDKALAVPYVTNRAIMDRLDDVVGPANWKNEFVVGPTGVLCALSIRVPNESGPGFEWVTKWDGAEQPKGGDEVRFKGALSGAMKRAAVQWGIGRYLYEIPPIWHPCETWEKDGKRKFSKWKGEPAVPPQWRASSQGSSSRSDVHTGAQDAPAEAPVHKSVDPGDEAHDAVEALMRELVDVPERLRSAYVVAVCDHQGVIGIQRVPVPMLNAIRKKLAAVDIFERVTKIREFIASQLGPNALDELYPIDDTEGGIVNRDAAGYAHNERESAQDWPSDAADDVRFDQ